MASLQSVNKVYTTNVSKNHFRSSYKGRMVDALALDADERRDKLR